MREEVYDYLREYGFTMEEVNGFQDENEKMFFTNLIEVNKNINFLVDKGLSKEDIMEVIRKNPFMITEKNNRLDALDNIYINKLRIDKEELKKLIIDNPYTYIESPIEIDKLINYMEEHKCDIKTIKKFFLENPGLISLEIDEFVSKVNFK